MKNIVSLLLALMFLACSSEKNQQDTQSTDIPVPERVTTPPANTSQPAAAKQVNVPAGANDKVAHYVCPDGCDGGVGDAAGSCSVCGKPMVHNQVFHEQKPDDNPNAETSPEPAQNAKGVWHYTCPSGCTGGAGLASACAKCTATLVHNQEYHK